MAQPETMGQSLCRLYCSLRFFQSRRPAEIRCQQRQPVHLPFETQQNRSHVASLHLAAATQRPPTMYGMLLCHEEKAVDNRETAVVMGITMEDIHQ